MHRSSQQMHMSDELLPKARIGGRSTSDTMLHEGPADERRSSVRSARRVRSLVLVGALLAALAMIGASCTRNAEAFQSVQLANGDRRAQGLRNLTIDDTLVAKAQAWAEHMAAAGGISHSELTDGAGDNWRTLGENVGVASSVQQVHKLFMDSPPHRQNILNGSFSRIGTGVAQADGRYYVAQVFAG